MYSVFFYFLSHKLKAFNYQGASLGQKINPYTSLRTSFPWV